MSQVRPLFRPLENKPFSFSAGSTSVRVAGRSPRSGGAAAGSLRSLALLARQRAWAASEACPASAVACWALMSASASACEHARRQAWPPKLPRRRRTGPAGPPAGLRKPIHRAIHQLCRAPAAALRCKRGGGNDASVGCRPRARLGASWLQVLCYVRSTTLPFSTTKFGSRHDWNFQAAFLGEPIIRPCLS